MKPIDFPPKTLQIDPGFQSKPNWGPSLLRQVMPLQARLNDALRILYKRTCRGKT